jgi:glycosyltransferase involved in cell wall biosynthesis
MNMPDNTVTVLISTFNRAHYLGECLDSIINQSIKPHQIIVIDDGSEDKTQNLLTTYADKLTVLTKENGGKSKALNMALPYISGEYVWIFDDDDVALPDSIESRLNVFHQHPDADVVYSSHFTGRDDANGKIQISDQCCLPKFDTDDLFFKVMNGYFFTLQGMLIRAKCIDKSKAFDDSLLRSQDYDFIINLARKYCFIGLNSPTFIIRRHTGSRGPKQDTHKNREIAWLKYDGLIGHKIRDSLELFEYLPKYSKKPNDRLALLRRMSVMASKGLIEEMLKDLQLALQNNSIPLTSLERQLCRQTVCHLYFSMRLSSDSELFFRYLAIIAQNNKLQIKPVLNSFLRGFFWTARHGNKTIKENLTYLNYTFKIIKIYLLSLKS